MYEKIFEVINSFSTIFSNVEAHDIVFGPAGLNQKINEIYKRQTELKYEDLKQALKAIIVSNNQISKKFEQCTTNSENTMDNTIDNIMKLLIPKVIKNYFDKYYFNQLKTNLKEEQEINESTSKILALLELLVKDCSQLTIKECQQENVRCEVKKVLDKDQCVDRAESSHSNMIPNIFDLNKDSLSALLNKRPDVSYEPDTLGKIIDVIKRTERTNPTLELAFRSTEHDVSQKTDALARFGAYVF